MSKDRRRKVTFVNEAPLAVWELQGLEHKGTLSDDGKFIAIDGYQSGHRGNESNKFTLDWFKTIEWIPNEVPADQQLHVAGAKADAGKLRAGLVLGGFSRALKAVAEVGTFGANKYTANGWVTVPNGLERYEDAGERHRLDRRTGVSHDAESGLRHRAHEAWNALALLELELRAEEESNV